MIFLKKANTFSSNKHDLQNAGFVVKCPHFDTSRYSSQECELALSRKCDMKTTTSSFTT